MLFLFPPAVHQSDVFSADPHLRANGFPQVLCLKYLTHPLRMLSASQRALHRVIANRALFPVFSLIFCFIAFRDVFGGNHLVTLLFLLLEKYLTKWNARKSKLFSASVMPVFSSFRDRCSDFIIFLRFCISGIISPVPMIMKSST